MRKRFFLVATALALLVLAWSATQLPDRVAIHFGVDGTADGWASRTGAVVAMGAVTLGTAVLFGFLGRWMTTMPWSMVNLPEAAKRRWVEAGKEDDLRRSLADDLYVVGGLTMVLLAGVQVLTVVANRRAPDAELGAGAIVLVGLYLVAITIWTFKMLTKYRRPPA